MNMLVSSRLLIAMFSIGKGRLNGMTGTLRGKGTEMSTPGFPTDTVRPNKASSTRIFLVFMKCDDDYEIIRY